MERHEGDANRGNQAVESAPHEQYVPEVFRNPNSSPSTFIGVVSTRPNNVDLLVARELGRKGYSIEIREHRDANKQIVPGQRAIHGRDYRARTAFAAASELPEINALSKATNSDLMVEGIEDNIASASWDEATKRRVLALRYKTIIDTVLAEGPQPLERQETIDRLRDLAGKLHVGSSYIEEAELSYLIRSALRRVMV